ncbi:MAG: hypothetical protein IPM37_07325 [Hahellaceae bacterium]|nr:hypothetical protein [Hahellaceae bacterium]
MAMARWRHATETLTVATSRALDARIQYPGEGSVSSASEPLTVEGICPILTASHTYPST